MNNPRATISQSALLLLLGSLLLLAPSISSAQSFDFTRLEAAAKNYTVILDIKIEVTFGMQSTEQEQRMLGTIVSEDGMVLFDGAMLANEQMLSSMAGMNIKTTPSRIEVQTLDGKKFKAEYVGVDRFTKFGFCKVTDAGATKFSPVKFVNDPQFKTGSWVALYMLLPEFVTPPIAADIGMISTHLEKPEPFALTVGFNAMEMASVLYNEQHLPVGVLGSLLDPTSANTDPSGMVESFNQFEIPLLGVVTGDRIAKLVSSPPKKGEQDRSWLGITLQALTPDIAEFLHLAQGGGIIVNDVVKDSPAEKARLKVGDIIYQINGDAVEVDKEEEVPIFQRRIAEMPTGTQVEFSILRPDNDQVDTLKLLAKLESAPMTALNAPNYENKALEFTARNIVFGDYVARNLEVGSLSGVVISEMQEGGLAEVGGLQMGDIVQRIGSDVVTSVDDVKTSMESIETQKPREVIFFVWRDNKTMFVNVKTDWK
jgi:serine protease Do